MYINTATGQFPYTVGDFRRDNKHISFPRQIPESTLLSRGIRPVTVEDQPEYNVATQRLEQSATPVFQEDLGEWTLGWTVVDMTDEEVTANDEITAAANRTKRNELLAATDYFALTDVTMDAAMTTYRQALRDITTHANWPHLDDADWPVKP